MKYIESNTIENYNITHHIVHFPYGDGEVILLLPRNKDFNIIVGVNRIPFLEFMCIPYTVMSYEFFECDIDIDYNFTNNEVLITNKEQIRYQLIEFSRMVYGILKSAGTDTKYLSQTMQQDIVFAIKHRNCNDENEQIPLTNEYIILGKVYETSSNYEILINNEIIFRSQNRFAVNKIWDALKYIICIFKRNIINRL